MLDHAAHRVWDSGAACIALASLCFSVAGALIRPLSHFNVFEIVMFRSALSLLFTVSLFAWTKEKQATAASLLGTPKHMPLLACRGLVGASAMDCFYASIVRLSLGDAVSLQFLSPMVTALLGWLILKESLSWRGIGGCFASLCGMVLVVHPPFLFGGGTGSDAWGPKRAAGTGFGLGSAGLAACAYITIRVIGKRESSLTVASWFHLTALAHSSVATLVGWPAPFIWPTARDWVCLVAIAVSSFSANILITRGFQQETAALGSAISYSQVVYSHIIGAVLLGETESWVGVLGAALIAAGVMAVAVDSKRRKRQLAEEAAAGDGEEEYVGEESRLLGFSYDDGDKGEAQHRQGSAAAAALLLQNIKPDERWTQLQPLAAEPAAKHVSLGQIIQPQL